MGMANTDAPLSGREAGGWRKMYNVSRLNGSIVFSEKGRHIRLGELLNPPRWFIFSYFPPFLSVSRGGDLQERIWLRDTVWFDYLLREVWLKYRGSLSRCEIMYNFVFEIEYLKPADSVTSLDALLKDGK